MPGSRQKVTVNGRSLALTNLDKVIYPSTGMTKAQVIEYLVAVREPLLAQLAGRPVTRVRWNAGTGSSYRFFEKNVPKGSPGWLRRVTVEPFSGGGSRWGGGEPSHEPTVYPVIDDVAGLTWLGNQNALELHTPQWRFDPDGNLLPPDRFVVDLDPGEGCGLAECAEVAMVIADRMTAVGLRPTPVTSGSKGLQLYAPWPAGGVAGTDDVQLFAKALAKSVVTDHKAMVTDSPAKPGRRGKVFFDWSQNNPGKTTITPYSLRGRSEPTVAAPRRWAELDDDRLRQLRYDEVVQRLATDGDLFGRG